MRHAFHDQAGEQEPVHNLGEDQMWHLGTVAALA